jgi:hypothetical protein
MLALAIGVLPGTHAQATGRLAESAEVSLVSPRSRDGAVAGLDSGCVTFTWSRSAAAQVYELVVFEVDEVSAAPLEPPVTRVDLPPGATTWVATDRDCLEPGRRYAWAVRAFGEAGESSVSEPVLFDVRPAPSRDELREALELLRRYVLAAEGDLEDESVEPNANAAERAALDRPARLETSARLGPAGRAVASSPAATSTPASFASSGIDRSSASAETFDIRNSGDGSMTLLVDGSAVLTAATQHRQFYLTEAAPKGNQALTACAAGFHMASLWELYDVTMRYAADQPAFLNADSGEGPPFGPNGWVRTGGSSSTTDQVGLGNCALWTSESASHFGTLVGLQTLWTAASSVSSPWIAVTSTCSTSRRVWCVQD